MHGRTNERHQLFAVGGGKVDIWHEVEASWLPMSQAGGCELFHLG